MGNHRVDGDAPLLPGLEALSPAQLALFSDLPVLRAPATGERLAAWRIGLGTATGRITGCLPAPALWCAALGTRVGAALRRRYPAHTAKTVARALSDLALTVDPRTVEGWLAGQAPCSRHLAALALIHGASFVAELFAPPGSEWIGRARLADELTRIRGELARLGQAP